MAGQVVVVCCCFCFFAWLLGSAGTWGRAGRPDALLTWLDGYLGQSFRCLIYEVAIKQLKWSGLSIVECGLSGTVALKID
jgi:hypothetical protein